MMLREAFSQLPSAKIFGNADVDVLGIQMDSKKIRKGDLFAAVRGKKTDGRAYVPEAVSNGAVAIWTEEKFSSASPLPAVRLDGIRKNIGEVAAKIYGYPTHRMTVVGVTGTNGKTTVCHLIESVLKHARKETAYLGTTDYRWKGVSLGADRTTPEAPELQRMFSQMLAADVDHAVMECSSHGIDLGRLNGIEFDVAVFTNLTQDHLDYHGTMEGYAQTKRKLFFELLGKSAKKTKACVLNLDDPYGRAWFAQNPSACVGYSIEQKSNATVYAKTYDLNSLGIRAEIAVGNRTIRIQSPLVGLYNVSNLLAAIATTYAMGIPTEKIEEGLSNFANVPGRMERVENRLNLSVIVDYAHTDDAMKNVLATLRPICKGKLVVVFGCGGDRDKTKRPKMMRAVEDFADIVVVTIDNPRTEDPRQIVADILTGHEPSKGKTLITELDRKEAIHRGIDLADPDDIVLITGKGHETYQEVHGQKIPFDDRQVAKAYMEERAR